MKKHIEAKINTMKKDMSVIDNQGKIEYMLDLYKLHEKLSNHTPSANDSIDDELDGAEMYLMMASKATDPEIHKLRKQQAMDELEHAKINAYIYEKLGHEVDDYNQKFNEMAHKIKAV